MLVSGLLALAVLGAASTAMAEVKVERVTYLNQPNCIRLSNGTVEVVITTAIGASVIRYAFIGGRQHPRRSARPHDEDRASGTGSPGAAIGCGSDPRGCPQLLPDNDPVQDARIEGNTVHLVQAVEPKTSIQKEMTVTLAPTGTAVTIGHRLVNKSLWRVDIAPWALTIMNYGGAVILPQEPYKSHDEALLPVRSVTLWAYSDLSDPRWQHGRSTCGSRPTPRARRHRR
jgi:hypothetical protein